MNDLGRQLTEKERKVYCALVKYPTKNDRLLSDITGINLSTVTAIRRRLSSKGYYNKVIVPMAQHLGSELLVVSYGGLSNTMPRKKRDELCDKYAKECDNTFLFFTSDDFGICMAMSRNYTEVKQDVDRFQQFLSKNDMHTASSWHYVIFPFEVSVLINFFDFSYLMSHLFQNSPYKVPDVDLKYKKYDRYDFSAKEKAAYFGLVAEPDLPDNALASKVDVSRQTLSNMRKRFEELGLIHEMNMPDIRKFSGILAFSHMLFNPDCMLEDRKNGIRMVLESSPTIFLVSGSFESTLLHIVSDYEEYSMLKNKLISYYASKKFLRGEGALHLMPLNCIKVHKNFDFTGILRSLQ